MLAFYMNIFSLILYVFTRSILLTKIPNATISYSFYASFLLLSNTFIQLSFFLDFLASSLFVICIAMSLFSKMQVVQSVIIVILFFMRYALIFYITSFSTYFFISFTEILLLLSFATILLFLLWNG